MSGALLASGAPTVPLALTVNGRRVTALVEPRLHLADFLRETLDLTGTHLGCEHGVCGACTVLIDGEPARSCIAYAAGFDGAAITTIEGLDDDEVGTELRAAFTREHALQCGYCTPGMLVSARDLVLRLPAPDETRVRLGLSGNLCRCTGYVGIVRAVLAVIADRRGRGIAPVILPRQLGPVGAQPGSAEPDPPAARPATPAPPAASSVRAADFQPAHSFTQSFTVPFPPDRIYALFNRPDEVAACLPGAALTGQPAPDRVEGSIRVNFGPITAAFAGTAQLERDDATRSGRIIGAGQDAGGRSSTQGRIDYRILPDDDAGSVVELTVGYTLKGPLAQFGRPALVRDLAGRITAAFATNLAARLEGRAVSPPARGLSLAALLSAVIGGWLGKRFRRR